jgi:stage II sporulation protein M
MGSYIAVSLVLFLAGIVAGTSTPGLDAYMNSQIEGIREIAKAVNDTSNPTLMMFLVIFFNNAIKAALVIYLGFFFGLFPVFFMVLNGLIIGYLIHNYAVTYGGAEAFEIVVRGILPHGIIEIPVLIIASAYGLKSGSYAFRFIGQIFAKDEKLSHEAGQYVRATVPIVIGVAVLLLAASLIESIITPIVIGK